MRAPCIPFENFRTKDKAIYFIWTLFFSVSVMGSKSNQKRDLFGRPVKERFPHYPYGVIIAGCSSGPCNRHRRPSSKSSCLSTQKSSDIPSTIAKQNQDRSNELQQQTPTSTAANNRNVNVHKSASSSAQKNHHISSEEACRKIAHIVAQELPQCSNQEFLKEIEQKCRNYWDNLSRQRIYLDENEVCRELTLKLQAWAQDNVYDNCCDDHNLSSSSSFEETLTRTTFRDADESRIQTTHNDHNDLEDDNDDDDDYSEQLRFLIRYGAPP